MPHAAGTRPPYAELLFGRIREIHDQVYFGRWRREDATENDLQGAKGRLAEFVGLLVREAGSNPPLDQRDYLDKTLGAFRDAQTLQGSELLLALNNTLSYGHRLLNFLLRARGEPNHVSRDFAKYHESSDEGDE
ncbi:MAG TPA: hypothetical protein VGC81_15350 [Candidatus Methylomirabilis sp.]|jgi:hypothetical protein